MSKALLRAGLGLTLGALMSTVIAVAQAGDDGGAFADVVSVELVLVDVVVETREGEPVLDLGREDFQLFQDGRPVEISQFSPAGGPPAAGAATGAGESGAVLPAPRRLVIFVDNLHLHPNSRRLVFGKLLSALDQHLEPRDEVMLVAYGGTTEVVLEMTTNRRALRSALREQAESGAVSLLAINDEERILDFLQQVRFQQASASAVGPDGACRDVGHMAHSHAQQVYGRVVGTISELERFVNSLAGYEGPKMLLHVSDGIPLIAGAEAYYYAKELCDGTGVNKGIPNAMDTTASNGLRYNYWDPTHVASTLREFDTSNEWTRLAGDANTYQVSFHTFQAHQPSNRSGSADGTRTSFDVEMEGERNKQDALFLLADETGGVAHLDANDVEPALARMSDDARFGYQLAFEPPLPGDGRQHELRVEVGRPGLRVRHRKSYRSKPLEERVEDRVVSALLHGEARNPLAVRLEVAEILPGERDLHHVRLEVRVPFDKLVLLPEEGLRRGLFSVFIAARNDFGQVTPVGRKTVPLSLPLGEGEKEFVYTVEIPIRGERGSVAVAVQDQLGAETSYVRQDLRLASSS